MQKNTKTLTVLDVAKVCHETNRAFCQTLGDNSQPSWELAPDWQSDSAVQGVRYHLSHPDSKPCDSHNSWLAVKRAEGWCYGPVKDAKNKTHPCFVPYEELPKEQQAKDALFIAVVRSLAPLVIDK